mmetsp:Transcript_13475/g.31821  ORF Transcript_13475/g.31821 Transcript_13475/m.31821 type:complete len:213 (+) Transcript_13475:67-705(+)
MPRKHSRLRSLAPCLVHRERVVDSLRARGVDRLVVGCVERQLALRIRIVPQGGPQLGEVLGQRGEHGGVYELAALLVRVQPIAQHAARVLRRRHEAVEVQHGCVRAGTHLDTYPRILGRERRTAVGLRVGGQGAAACGLDVRQPVILIHGRRRDQQHARTTAAAPPGARHNLHEVSAVLLERHVLAAGKRAAGIVRQRTPGDGWRPRCVVGS